jgi:hypothetical protein
MTTTFYSSGFLNRPMRRFSAPRLSAHWPGYRAPEDAQLTARMKFAAVPFSALFFGARLRLLADHICRRSYNPAGECANTQ